METDCVLPQTHSLTKPAQYSEINSQNELIIKSLYILFPSKWVIPDVDCEFN